MGSQASAPSSHATCSMSSSSSSATFVLCAPDFTVSISACSPWPCLRREKHGAPIRRQRPGNYHSPTAPYALYSLRTILRTHAHYHHCHQIELIAFALFETLTRQEA